MVTRTSILDTLRGNFSLRAAFGLIPRADNAGTGTLGGLWTQHRAEQPHKCAHLHFHRATEQGEASEEAAQARYPGQKYTKQPIFSMPCQTAAAV